MAELVQVSAQVPADRVSEFYELVAMLHRPKSQPWEAETQEETLLPWSKEDEQRVKQVFFSCSPNARKVLSYLASHPGQQILGADIATALGLPKGQMSVAGTLGPVGVHCKKVGRFMPYETSYATDATAAFYVMAPEVAEMFKKVQER